MSDIQELINEVNRFVEERDWSKFHTPKDLAISISLEASELLEDFQWVNSEQAEQENLQNMKEELADVMIYCLMFSEKMSFDIKQIILDKLEMDRQKYPVEEVLKLPNNKK